MATQSQPDLSEFYKLSKPKKPPCQVGNVLMNLEGQEAEEFAAALATDNNVITNSAISAWLKQHGQGDVNTQRISVHRRKACTCANG